MMVRLTLLLCAGLFLAMWGAGAEPEIKRFGLMAKDANPLQPRAPQLPSKSEPVEIVSVAFAPTAPVMQLPDPPQADSQPEIIAEALGPILRVRASSANVRGGPGTNYAVIGKLQRGDEVLVVLEPQATGGWARIRIEGDGVEGYVASRLLRQ